MGYLNSAGLTRLWYKINSTINTKLASLSGLQNENLLINGNFQVWQRGTSKIVQNTRDYVCDRFRSGSNTGKCEVKKTSVGMRVTMQTVGSLIVNQMIPNTELDLSGKTVTLSVKSTFSGNLVLHFYAMVGGNWIDVANMWLAQGITSMTCTVPANTTLFCCEINSGDIPVNSFLEMSYIKLEYGSVATACNPKRLGDVLQQCKRYYQVLYIGGQAYSTTLLPISHSLPVEMRVAPNLVYVSTCIGGSSHFLDKFGQGGVDIGTLTVGGLSNMWFFYIKTDNPTLTAGQHYDGVAVLECEI